METYQPLNPSSSARPTTAPLKDSIRDMVRLQRDYQLSDELFWEIFNTRVLLNQPIDVHAYAQRMSGPVARA